MKEDSSTISSTPSESQSGTVVTVPTANAASRHPSYVVFNEDEAKRALTEARGDIFVASQLLGVTAIRLDRAIQVSEVLRVVMDESKKHSRATSDADLHSAIEQRIGLYRVVGLDALHDLAVMPIDENSAQNQVKLAAAARLAGGLEGGGAGGEMGEALRELRDLYQKNAPRLRVIRERTTVELSPQDERVVSEQGKPE